MSRNFLYPAILMVFIGFLIFFRPFYGWKLNGFFSRQNNITSESDIMLENQVLKAEVAKLQNIKSELPERPRGFTRAIVYSRYPFNFKNEFLIDAGKNEGIASSSAVTFGEILIGRTATVFENDTLVQTVFDAGFQIPVRIGYLGTEALFKGGAMPKAVLIPPKSQIQKGDIVYSSSSEFPYGLPIGEIGSVGMSNDRVFQEATIDFAYDINTVEAVLISKK